MLFQQSHQHPPLPPITSLATLPHISMPCALKIFHPPLVLLCGFFPSGFSCVTFCALCVLVSIMHVTYHVRSLLFDVTNRRNTDVTHVTYLDYVRVGTEVLVLGAVLHVENVLTSSII